MRAKRGPRIVTDDVVIRSYEFGEVKGSITLASSTPLDVVGSSIVKRFHHENVSYFRTELKDGVYVVSEKVHHPAATAPAGTFIEWKNTMLPQYPNYLFSALNSVEMIPPLLLSSLIVPNVIYSHRLDNGRFYYAFPSQYVPIRLRSGCSKLMQRAAAILDGYVGLQSVSMIGILGTSVEDCGFSPASFKFVDGAVFHWGEAEVPPPPPLLESAESSSFILAPRIMALLADYPDHSPFVDILKRYQPPNFNFENEIDVGSLPMQALQEIEAYFIKKRADLKQSVLTVFGKRKLTALTKKYGDFASINYATFCEIAAIVSAAPPLPTPRTPSPPKLSHEELAVKAREVKANTAQALEELQDELKRSCGKVVRKDHIVSPSADVGACYRAPTEEEIRKQIAESSSSSSD